MTSDPIRIRVRSGQNEAEVEADLAHIAEAIELIPEIIAKFPSDSNLQAQRPAPRTEGSQTQPQTTGPSGLPSVSIEKGDSLGDILSKFFADPWGKIPRKLWDAREALQSYGLNYPKQSVAVALLRLAKGSRIRRFKAEGGEFVYTASTALLSAPQNPVVEESSVPDLSATNV